MHWSKCYAYSVGATDLLSFRFVCGVFLVTKLYYSASSVVNILLYGICINVDRLQCSYLHDHAMNVASRWVTESLCNRMLRPRKHSPPLILSFRSIAHARYIYTGISSPTNGCTTNKYYTPFGLRKSSTTKTTLWHIVQSVNTMYSEQPFHRLILQLYRVEQLCDHFQLGIWRLQYESLPYHESVFCRLD